MWAQGLDFAQTPQGGDFLRARGVQRVACIEGFTVFRANIKPLYTSDGIQAPLITGEEQYEARWTITASMQYNPVINVAAEQFDAVGETSVIAADLLNPV